MEDKQEKMVTYAEDGTKITCVFETGREKAAKRLYDSFVDLVRDKMSDEPSELWEEIKNEKTESTDHDLRKNP